MFDELTKLIDELLGGKPAQGWQLYARRFVLLLTAILGIVAALLSFAKGIEQPWLRWLVLYAAVFLAAAPVSAWVRRAQKPTSDKFGPGPSAPRFDARTVAIAGRVLRVSLVALLLIPFLLGASFAVSFFRERARFDRSPIADAQFGIVIASFGKGPNYDDSANGLELAQLLADNLQHELAARGLADQVVVRRWETIRTQPAAEKLARELAADLVVWGYMPLGTQDAIVPQFTFSESSDSLPTVTRAATRLPLQGLETLELGRALSSQTAILTASVLGFAFLERGQYDQALARFSDAVAIAEESEQLLSADSVARNDLKKELSLLCVFRGLAYDGLGRLADARRDFDRASSLDPSSRVPHVALGNLLYTQRDWPAAQTQYALAVSKEPGSPVAHYSLGNALFYQGQYRQAALEYELAATFDPDFALALFALGIASEQLNDCPAALEAYRRVQAIAPDGPLAAEATGRAAQCGTPTAAPHSTLTSSPPSVPTLLPTASPHIAFIYRTFWAPVGVASLAVVFAVLFRVFLNWRAPRAPSASPCPHPPDPMERDTPWDLQTSWSNDNVNSANDTIDPYIELPPHHEVGRGYTHDPSDAELAAHSRPAWHKVERGRLLDQLRDPDRGRRRAAAEELGVLGDRRAVEPLIEHLVDHDEYVRDAAAWALGELGDPRAVEPLIARLDDDNPFVRRAAAEALGRLGDRRAVPALRALLEDPSPYVRQAAADALEKLGDS